MFRDPHTVQQGAMARSAAVVLSDTNVCQLRKYDVFKKILAAGGGIDK
jgi:hypothetical protein